MPTVSVGTHAICSALIALCLIAGCSAPATPLELSPPSNIPPRSGAVYMLRGLWAMSPGFDDMGQQLAAAGVRTTIYAQDQWTMLADRLISDRAAAATRAATPDPIVLIGHSFGADNALRIARRLGPNGIHIDLLIALNPDSPPAVPGNADRVIDLYQPGIFDFVPIFRGIPLSIGESLPGEMQNIDITRQPALWEAGTDHFNIASRAKIRQVIVAQVLSVCPPANR